MLFPVGTEAQASTPQLRMTPGWRPEDVWPHGLLGGGNAQEGPGSYLHSRSLREIRAGKTTHSCEASSASRIPQRGAHTEPSSGRDENTDSWACGPRFWAWGETQESISLISAEGILMPGALEPNLATQWKLLYLTWGEGKQLGSACGRQLPVSGVEHNLPAAMRRKLPELRGRHRRACLSVCLPALVSTQHPAWRPLPFSENISIL